MPITKSAEKALRASARKRVNNERRATAIRLITKKAKKLAREGKVKEARALMPEIQQAYDKAAKTGLIKKNAASRKKSRLSSLLKKSSTK